MISAASATSTTIKSIASSNPIKRIFISNAATRTYSLALNTNRSGNWNTALPTSSINRTANIPLNKCLFSTETNLKTEDETSKEENANHNKSGNILYTTFQKEAYTPGQALFVLLKKGAKGRPIRHGEFVALCKSARQGKKRDAQRILNATKHFKRCSEFYITTPLAYAAIENMMKAMTYSKDGVITGRDKVEAGLFVCNAFLDLTTGLYYAVPANDFETLVLKPMLEGLQQDDIYSTTISTEEQTDDDDDDLQKHKKNVIYTIKNTMKLFVRRATTSIHDMKTRHVYHYKKRLMVKGDLGPAHSTIHLATKICVQVGKPADATEGFIYHYEKYLNRSITARTKIVLEKSIAAAKEKEDEAEEVCTTSAEAETDNELVDDSETKDVVDK